MDELDEILIIALVALIGALLPTVIIGLVVNFLFDIAVTRKIIIGIYILVWLANTIYWICK